MLAAMLACTALAGCGKKETTDEFAKTVEVETDVVAETEEPEVIESEVAAEPEVNDPTYCNLMSDPYFDMENAIRDDWFSDYVMNDDILSKNGYEVLFNYVDGAKYAEITGATVTEINKTITNYPTGTAIYPQLAYYGVNPNPGCFFTSEFELVDTSAGNKNDIDLKIPNEKEITVLKAYSIPKDRNGKDPVVSITDSYANSYANYEKFLCEVEYEGKQGYTILDAFTLGLAQ